MSAVPSRTLVGPDLDFTVLDVRPVDLAAAPTLGFVIGIRATEGVPVRSLQLRTQVRIAAARRPYEQPTKQRLSELFGGPESFGRNLRSLPWTDTSMCLMGFERETEVEIPVPCTYDLEVTASKYLSAVGNGSVPLDLLFSGSVFYEDRGDLRVVQIPWEKEAAYCMPARVWHDLMERYFPGAAWLKLESEVFARLRQYRSDRTLLTWDRTVEDLLEKASSFEQVERGNHGNP